MQKYFEDMAKAKAGEDTGRSGGLSNLFGAGLGIAGSLFGGPMGGAIGSGIGNLFGGGGDGGAYDNSEATQFTGSDQMNQYF